MTEENINKIKRYLRLIEAQAAVFYSEMRDEMLWTRDESAKLGIIQNAVNQISIIKDWK